MKIVIPGGSGQVGAVLSRAFRAEGHDVVVLSRRPLTRLWRVVTWDGSSSGSWSREVDGADVVINLAGRSVNCRYNPANRRQMIDSRVQSRRRPGDRGGAMPAARLAPGEHRHDLCTSLRCRQRPCGNQRRAVTSSHLAARSGVGCDSDEKNQRCYGEKVSHATGVDSPCALAVTLDSTPSSIGVMIRS